MQKKLLVTAVAAAMALPTVAQALDTKISGHVNRMIRFADNGAGSDVQFTDNTASQSRFRFNTSGSIGNGITGGIIYEAGFASNTSGGTPTKVTSGSDANLNLRHNALYMEGSFGRVTLGHTSEASDGMLFADLSGTGLGDEVSAIEHGSAIVAQGGGNAATTWGSIVTAPDGKRQDVLRYDTPNLGGIGKIAASVGNNERWALGAFLGGSAGGGEWQLNAGYTRLGEGNNDADEFAISGSYLFAQGTNVTLAYGTRDNEDGTADDEQDVFYVKLGHKFGNTAVSVSYGTGETRGTDWDTFGAGLVHQLQGGAEVYAGYTLAMADTSTGDFDDLNMFVVGSRIKFN